MKYCARALSAFLLLLMVVPGLAQDQPTPASDVLSRIEAFENGLLPLVMSEDQDAMTLSERMQFYNVPGVSIAVINDYQVEWARGYGVLDTTSQRPVTDETLFQAASISKAIAATAALQLVQDGQIDLDTDVNEYLTTWSVPSNEFTTSEPVTLRHLLSHTAGTSVSGFIGYAQDEVLPTTLQILNGEPPANSAPVVVEGVPGEEWVYSGGGYTIIQQLIEDVTGQAFPDALRTLVLDPTEMVDSTFVQPLPDALQTNVALGHRLDGSLIEGGWRNYPEYAAAGLWTTPTDLAHWAIALQRAYQGESGVLLSQASVDAMTSEQMGDWGLGVMVGNSGEDAWFAHAGGNMGFRSNVIAFVENGQGAVVMTNSDNGVPLYEEIFRALANVYEWSDIGLDVRQVVTIDPTIYDRYAGSYVSGFLTVTVARDDDQLVLTLPAVAGGTTIPLYPLSETEFFDVTLDIDVTFILNEDGTVQEVQASAPTLGEFTFMPRP